MYHYSSKSFQEELIDCCYNADQSIKKAQNGHLSSQLATPCTLLSDVSVTCVTSLAWYCTSPRSQHPTTRQLWCQPTWIAWSHSQWGAQQRAPPAAKHQTLNCPLLAGLITLVYWLAYYKMCSWINSAQIKCPGNTCFGVGVRAEKRYCRFL